MISPRFRFKWVLACAAATLAPLAATADFDTAEQERFLKVNVPPHYEHALARSLRPTIRVVSRHSEKLRSLDRASIAQVRDEIAAKEATTVTPVVMMVLAIRLYDVGLRDDAVFWFLAARERFTTIDDVMDADSEYFYESSRLTRAFLRLAGAGINGYALCDLNRAKSLHRKALEWVEANPFHPIFVEQIPARPGDRKANLKRSTDALWARLKEEQEFLDIPANAAKLAAGRKATRRDERYCW